MEYLDKEPIIEEKPVKVYLKTNANNEIIEVKSSIFIEDKTGWIEIDEGYGDKFVYAQSQYFKKPLFNVDDLTYNYSYINGKIIEK